jgi:hypothetical protein
LLRLFGRLFFFGVSDRFFAATRCEWIRLGTAMTDAAKIDSAAYANTAALIMTMMIVMFPAAALTTSAASAGRTFARAARTTCRFARRARR